MISITTQLHLCVKLNLKGFVFSTLLSMKYIKAGFSDLRFLCALEKQNAKWALLFCLQICHLFRQKKLKQSLCVNYWKSFLEHLIVAYQFLLALKRFSCFILLRENVTDSWVILLVDFCILSYTWTDRRTCFVLMLLLFNFGVGLFTLLLYVSCGLVWLSWLSCMHARTKDELS